MTKRQRNALCGALIPVACALSLVIGEAWHSYRRAARRIGGR